VFNLALKAVSTVSKVTFVKRDKGIEVKRSVCGRKVHNVIFWLCRLLRYFIYFRLLR